MAPSAVSTTPQEVQQVSELNAAAIAQKIAETAPEQSNIVAEHTLAPLNASKLIFTPTTAPREVPALDSPLIAQGGLCTDHMITATWNEREGWAAPELRPYGPLNIMPTASVLHYATECFEGMKVYRGYDGKLRLFRPDCNARRFLVSSTRIALPAFDPVELEKLIMAMLEVDGSKWLPKDRPGHFLYLRPTLIGTAARLGPQPPNEAMLFILANFMQSYDEPKNGMKLLASQEDMVRAWPGGFGYAKVGANYGPALLAQGEARRRGYDQILWLFGENSQVTEAGASNFCVVWKTKEGKLQLVTAPLDDKVILDGVTRRSLLQLTRERLSDNKTGLEPIEVVERKFTMGEIKEAIEENRMVEAFACGTAFFVVPVSEIFYRGESLNIPMAKGNTGEYAALLKSWLRNIMYGKEQHEWGVVVNEKEA